MAKKPKETALSPTQTSVDHPIENLLDEDILPLFLEEEQRPEEPPAPKEVANTPPAENLAQTWKTAEGQYIVSETSSYAQPLLDFGAQGPSLPAFSFFPNFAFPENTRQGFESNASPEDFFREETSTNTILQALVPAKIFDPAEVAPLIIPPTKAYVFLSQNAARWGERERWRTDDRLGSEASDQSGQGRRAEYWQFDRAEDIAAFENADVEHPLTRSRWKFSETDLDDVNQTLTVRLTDRDWGRLDNLEIQIDHNLDVDTVNVENVQRALLTLQETEVKGYVNPLEVNVTNAMHSKIDLENAADDVTINLEVWSNSSRWNNDNSILTGAHDDLINIDGGTRLGRAYNGRWTETDISTGDGDDRVLIASDFLSDDTVNLDTGNDLVSISAGQDTIDGGSGTDRAVFENNATDYTVNVTGSSSATITWGTGNSTILSNVEVLQFADGTVNIS